MTFIIKTVGAEMKIYCCECKAEVEARLTDGKEIYPHREDLYDLPFWKCNACKNYVGCHHKTKNRTKPLGVISNSEIKKARIQIHAILDPIWKNGFVRRGTLYAELSEKLGYDYHTGEIKSIEEARRVYVVVKELSLRFSKKEKSEEKIYNSSLTCWDHEYVDLPSNKKYSKIQKCVKCKSIARLLA